MNRLKLRKILRATAWGVTGAVLLSLAVLTYVLGPALYHHFYLFPRQREATRQLQAQRRDIPPPPGWKELVAACHVHSDLSHDSDGRWEDILRQARSAGVDVVLMADHFRDRKADFSLQWAGVHGGVRFFRGFEMRNGFMPWGLPESTVLNADEEPDRLARSIGELGGLLFFAHIEEPRRWELPQLTGLEIYNIHAAFKKRKLSRLVPDIILNGNAYPDQTLHLIFERPSENLLKWDHLSRDRRLAGIAGNDVHQNSGLQGFYTDRDSLKLNTTGPREVLGEWRLNSLTRFLLRLFHGPLQTTRPLFRYEADRYEPMMRFVNTHVWVRDEAETSILESLRSGRALIAFNHLASARGFQFRAESQGPGGLEHAVMGEQSPWRPGSRLLVESPLPCRFTLIRDGRVVRQQEGSSWVTGAEEPGKYRLEAELRYMGEWVPWVYSNPITLSTAQ